MDAHAQKWNKGTRSSILDTNKLIVPKTDNVHTGCLNHFGHPQHPQDHL